MRFRIKALWKCICVPYVYRMGHINDMSAKESRKVISSLTMQDIQWYNLSNIA